VSNLFQIKQEVSAEKKLGAYAVSVTHRPARNADSNTAPAIYLVHGMADTSASWSSVLDALDHCDVWLFDMPWSGNYGANWSSVQSATQWWTDAVALCPRKPDFCIGHSFATAVLAKWLMNNLDDYIDTRLALVSPIYLSTEQRLSWNEIDRFARNVPLRLVETIHNRIGNDRIISDDILASMADQIASRIFPEGLLELFTLLQRLSSAPIEKLAGRITLVQGDSDESLLSSCLTTFAQRTNSPYHELECCGHVPMVEKPDELTSILVDLVHCGQNAHSALNEVYR